MMKLETESQLQSSGENLSPLEAQCHIVEDHLCTTAAYSHCLCSFSSGCGHSCKVHHQSCLKKEVKVLL